MYWHVFHKIESSSVTDTVGDWQRLTQIATYPVPGLEQFFDWDTDTSDATVVPTEMTGNETSQTTSDLPLTLFVPIRFRYSTVSFTPRYQETDIPIIKQKGCFSINLKQTVTGLTHTKDFKPKLIERQTLTSQNIPLWTDILGWRSKNFMQHTMSSKQCFNFFFKIIRCHLPYAIVSSSNTNLK